MRDVFPNLNNFGAPDFKTLPTKIPDKKAGAPTTHR